MLFGKPSQFAVEAMLEPGPEYPAVQGSNLAGRIRVWVGDQEVGRFDEPACWLGPPASHLEEFRGKLDELWDPSLDGLDPDAIFDRLDYLYFAAHRGVSLRASWSAEQEAQHERESEGDWERFSFLIHSSEAFDGWKSWLLRPPGDELLVLVAKHPQKVVTAYRVPIVDFEAVVDAFCEWLRAEEERLLPRRGAKRNG